MHFRNGKKYVSVPVGHSVAVKEQYSNEKMVLEKLCYCEHNWPICVEFKMVNMLLGQQGEVIKEFVSNKKARNSKQPVNDMLENLQALGARMSIKFHYVVSHFENFPKNLGDVSEEQEERFHHHIRIIEERYQVAEIRI